jgi:hypothetical protein
MVTSPLDRLIGPKSRKVKRGKMIRVEFMRRGEDVFETNPVLDRLMGKSERSPLMEKTLKLSTVPSPS